MSQKKHRTMRLRADEKFVMEALSSHYGASWSVGPNPPDAYLHLNDTDVPVEITSLFQHVPGPTGLVSRITQDETAFRIIDELDHELSPSIRSGLCCSICLYSPVVRPRQLKARIRKRIIALLPEAKDDTQFQEEIFTNRVEISFDEKPNPPDHRVEGIVINVASTADTPSNARSILGDRISVKWHKCKVIALQVIPWLAILNKYDHANQFTYIAAMRELPIEHGFARICLVSREGTVTELFKKT